MATPQELRFAKTHEWVRVEGTVATIGISDHAQESLGDITFVDLPATGTAVTAGKECGVIESVKAASDIYSPVTGTVTAVNESLAENPEVINESPWSDGWLLKVTITDSTTVEALLSADAYDTFLVEND